ncbi:hypothetical protein UFOVP1229_121 [uncultured Caudovirales phage]|uniref:Uncharacterized protein n=1 Tax=uncultured Caudovirales phage TaxID=2100421 RepID=A0A6J5RE34_9CAUD|nr:hypothetical protein UFOVP1229_121 [uncultured Caudovirales phage]
MNPNNTEQPSPSSSDFTPHEVRSLISDVQTALEKIRGFLPANIAVPLMSAQGKLVVAQMAVDAWESRLRLEKLEQ